MLVGLTLLWCDETLEELKIENGLVVGEIGDVFAVILFFAEQYHSITK